VHVAPKGPCQPDEARQHGPGISGIHPVIYEDEGKELPSGCAALLVPEVVEAAVVPVADEIKGKVPDLYVSLRPGLAASADIANKVSAPAVSEIGVIARPRRSVIIVPTCPTRARGRTLRRALAGISNGQDSGDVSTLANPEVVDMIKGLAKWRNDARGPESAASFRHLENTSTLRDACWQSASKGQPS
jgi:AMP-binding enzyme C-terminal domain